MTYYLYADSHRAEGKRYTRGAELPDDLGADLFGRGYAVDDEAQLAHRVRVPLTKESRKQLARLADSGADEVRGEAVIEETSGEGVTALGTTSQSALTDSSAGAEVTENEAARKPATTARRK